MRFVEWLHIGAAIFLIGPQMIAGAVSPRYIREGADGLPVVRFLNRTFRVYTLASIAVFLLGAALVPLAHHGFGEFWLSSSMTLFVVNIGLSLGLVERDQRRAVRRLESGEAATNKASRILGVSMAIGVIWLVILLLMIYRPGQ